MKMYPVLSVVMAAGMVFATTALHAEKAEKKQDVKQKKEQLSEEQKLQKKEQKQKKHEEMKQKKLQKQEQKQEQVKEKKQEQIQEMKKDMGAVSNDCADVEEELPMDELPLPEEE